MLSRRTRREVLQHDEEALEVERFFRRVRVPWELRVLRYHAEQSVARTAPARGPSDRRYPRWHANEIQDRVTGSSQQLAPESGDGRTR